MEARKRPVEDNETEEEAQRWMEATYVMLSILEYIPRGKGHCCIILRRGVIHQDCVTKKLD